MDFFPIFLNIRNRRCLVVGGGNVAERKIASLLKSGADVILISPDLTHNLTTWRDMGRFSHQAREFDDEDLHGAHLVIAATDNPEVNRRISTLAGEQRIPVNVVDQPELCSFILP
ncbi:MAG: bifunctional precorrin-2 dehydrogenase/sirohydrochlorin ferrochelatase, partial [Chromatiales bacterium]